MCRLTSVSTSIELFIEVDVRVNTCTCAIYIIHVLRQFVLVSSIWILPNNMCTCTCSTHVLLYALLHIYKVAGKQYSGHWISKVEIYKCGFAAKHRAWTCQEQSNVKQMWESMASSIATVRCSQFPSSMHVFTCICTMYIVATLTCALQTLVWREQTRVTSLIRVKTHWEQVWAKQTWAISVSTLRR